MQKLIFLRIGLVLNLLEDAVGRLARARARARTAGLHHLPTDLKLIYRKNDRKVLLITVRSTTTLDAFYWDSLYILIKNLHLLIF